MCWMSLAGPATESSTYVLIAPLLAWAVVEAAARPGWRRWLTGAIAGLFVVAATAVWFPRPVADAVATTGIQPLAALLLTLLVVIECAQKTAGHAEAPGGPEDHFLSDFGRSASSSRTAA
jgi:hypothetical protein